MPDGLDVVIVGGAAMGSSVAFHLLSDPAFRGRVTVLEKDPTYARAASALSASSIRQQFSTRVNIAISLYGIAFLRRVGEELAVEAQKPEIGLQERGYLTCAGPAGLPALSENVALQRKEGADIVLLDPGELAVRFPWLRTESLAGAAFGRSGEGWFDGWSLLQAFRAKARALGADYQSGEVAAVEHEGGLARAVRLADGSRIACDALVNCAGAGGRALAAMAGIDLPVVAKRRSVFSFACREPVQGCPLIVNTSGAWVRPEGEDFIAGISPGPDEADPDWQDDDPSTQEVDWPLFEGRIWPALAHRVPAFESIRPGRAWTGPYDMCLLDQNAVIGRAGPLFNVYLCNGFSGHGLQQAPAIGRGIAELIVHDEYCSLDLSDLAFDRVLANRPLRERNVI